MGAGSGGFYAAKEAFKQANQIGPGRSPRDFSASLMGLAGFGSMVAIWNTTPFVVAAIGVLVFLFGTAQGMIVTLLPRFRVRLRLAVAAAYGLSVTGTYLLVMWISRIIQSAQQEPSRLQDGGYHPFAACIALAVGYVAFTITRKNLWNRYAVQSFY